MKKKNIKDRTIIIIAVCVAIFLIISFVRKPDDKEAQREITMQEPHWADSLTNEMSDIPELSQMDSDITTFMNKWAIPGVSFAITRNDSLLYAKGYGFADREKGEPMKVDNIMRIASASKLVTATAIMKLKEQGKLTLDSKVLGSEGIINDTDITSSIKDKRHFDITVEDLLKHTGGFGRGAGDPMFRTKDIMEANKMTHAPTPHELTKLVVGRKLGGTPGVTRRYSNFGYFLLSLVIEKVSGQDYWTYVQENVLNPAGCHDFRPATNYYDEKTEKEVKYYAADDEMIEEYNNSGKIVPRCYGGSDVRGLMGAGGWCASAAEYSRFVAAIDGNPVIPDVISKEDVDLMTAYSDDQKLSMGWSDTDAAGRWTRTGTLSSTSAFVRHFPDGECWVFITNSGIWTGFRFSNDVARLVDRLRSKYSSQLPSRDLFK